MSEERRLSVFENRVLRRIFGPKRDGVTGEWRKLHNEELNDLDLGSNILLRPTKTTAHKHQHPTSTINQQMHLYKFHLKHFKTLKTTPTCFELFRSSSGSFVVPC